MNEHYPFNNPPLPYAYQAMEPYIDAKTMELHHDRHLQTYVDNLNGLLKDHPEYQNLSLEQLILYSGSMPSPAGTEIKNNAGGAYNHIFYFMNLADNGKREIPEPLGSMLADTFGSLENFKEKLTQAALSVFGSGYAWLALTPFRTMQIVTTANQDTPLPLGACPLLNVDVWEHAYYLKHYNVRKAYINDWFNVINWEQVNNHFLHCMNYYGF